jgi:chorismate mutase/prephenate dehydratase
MYFDSFEHVFRAVEAGMCQYGVLPIENSTAGSVNAIYDLMIRHNFSIVRSARLKVSHCLLANPGASLGGIKHIVSHQQAIEQCSDFLATMHGAEATAVSNTAAAAKMVAESGRTDIAAISSSRCGENYGLSILAPDIQDTGSNYTRFICISKKPEIYPGADRISLMMIIPHRPGSLYNVVSKFSSLGINMRKIESRPIPGRDFEFMFYFDIEASVYSPGTERLFRDLECASEQMRYLGAYSEVMC